MSKTTKQYYYYARTMADSRRLANALAEVAEEAEAGVVVALNGDLGAGKTFFASQFAVALGVAEVVNSPTFTIIKEYEGRKRRLHHLDVYRITEDEAADLGLDDYWDEGISLVEWAEKIPDLLPRQRLTICIRVPAHEGDEQERIYTLQPIGAMYEEWCQTLLSKGLLQDDNGK